MRKSHLAKRWRSAFGLMLVGTVAAGCGGGDPSPAPLQPSTPAVEEPAAPVLPGADRRGTVTWATRASSPALRSLKSAAPEGKEAREVARRNPARIEKGLVARAAPEADRALQADLPPPNMPAAERVIEGLGNTDNQAVLGFGVTPPDTNGDVGPNHYVQWVNLTLAVWDKQGNKILGPIAGDAIFEGLAGPCSANNDGDPIVLYDQLADRWVLSQFAITNDGHQCFAVSKTGDPTGEYWLYDFQVSTGGFNDYPKIGVWPDAYYATFNEFFADFSSPVALAFQRDAMLQGLPAAVVRFEVKDPAAQRDFFNLQPAHLEGMTPPPVGTPNPFVMAVDEQVWGPAGSTLPDHYSLWRFHVDWTNPGAATFLGPIDLPTEAFDAELCNFSRSCIPQKGTTTGLDSLGQFTMYRVAYRNLGDREVLTVSHTVDTSGASLAGIRWAELRDPNGTPTVFQTGTFAPADGNHRWMPSLAMDFTGNIALGYSVSGSNLNPSIRVTGRLADDAPGVMTQGELEIVAGAASQTGSNRWGDYASMSVDDADECTFWFTTMYTTGGTSWKTKIASFRFPSCQTGPTGFVTGKVLSANGGLPLSGAVVRTGAFSTLTDATGTYRLRLPVGTYELTASQFGFAPATATATVDDGATVIQDFALTPSATLAVQGYVHDGSGANWPLYARIDVTAPGAPPRVLHSDPLTGFWSTELLAGAEYTFTVTSKVPGYVAETRPVIVGGSLPALVNFGLRVNAGSCNAPGYAAVATELVRQSFESTFPGDGWTVSNQTTGCVNQPDWNTVNPGNRANLTGGTGKFAVADSDACGSSSRMDSSLFSPVLDLSSLANGAGGLQIELNHDFRDLGSSGTIDVWNGSAWVAAQTFGGVSDRGPKRLKIGTTAGNGRNDTRVRFRYVAPGWHWWWEIDEIVLSKTSCTFQGGGLVHGVVGDANTGDGVVGATVSVVGDPAVSATTVATPDDPALGDGFYLIYLAGPRVLRVTKSLYGSSEALVVPQWAGAGRKDFTLGAGRLVAAPGSFQVRVPVGDTTTRALTLTNVGTADAPFRLRKLGALPGNQPVGPFEPGGRRTSPKNIHLSNATGVNLPFPVPNVPQLAAGEVVGSFPAVAGSWGVGVDQETTDVWVGGIAPLGGDDKLHRFLNNGTNTGETVDTSGFIGVFGADVAYDVRRGTLWQVDVGGDNCIHEIDPIAKTVTGESICPAFGTSERGLAYDPVSDTFYAGSWNDGVVHQFDRDGEILRSVQTGLDVAGLAYNPSTDHLFVLTSSANPTLDIYVLDAADLSILGGFEVRGGSIPAFGSFEQAGLELDCAGNLVAVNQTQNRVFYARSGEDQVCLTGITWLAIAPASGTVPVGGVQNVTLTFDTSAELPGLKEAQILVATDTPYEVPSIPVKLTVAFRDIPAGYFADAEIHLLAGKGIAATCGAGNFCPTAAVTRGAYAPYLLRSKLGANYQPPRATGRFFDDVGPETFGADFIEDIARRGISLGCGGRRYCPDQALLRREAAVFLLRAIEGSSYQPPTGLPPVFNDVPDDPFRPWIDELGRRGIASGCGNGNFCPSQPLNRADSAVMLVRAFSLTLR